MDLESVPDTFEYPASQECQVNAGECTFDVDYLCHECGRQLCENCAIGIKHQPQLLKYLGPEIGEEDRTQVHCPDCTRGHDWNTTVLAFAGGSVVLGLLLLYFSGGSPIAIALIALLLVLSGSYLGYNEYELKKERDLWSAE